MLSTLRRPISSPPLRGRAVPRREGRPARLTEEVAYGQPSGLFSYNELERLIGNVDDLDITLGWKTKKDMMRDPFASGAIHTLCLGAVARAGEVKPTDSNQFHSADESEERKQEEKDAEETAEFCRRNLGYLRQRQRPIELTLYQLAVVALSVGFVNAEIVLHETDGKGVDGDKLTLERIKSKPRETTGFIIDKQMNVQGIAAFAGNASELQRFQEKRVSFESGMFAWNGLGTGWVWIDPEKFLKITHKPGDDDSPLGTSALRTAYAPWKFKRDNYAYWLSSNDNNSTPMLWTETQQALPKMKPLKSDGSVDENAAPVDGATVVYQALAIARRGGVAVPPAGVKVHAIFHANSGEPFGAFASYCDGQITQGILGQQLATNESRHMARAAGQVHQDVLDTYIKYVRRMLCDAVSRDVFGLLIRKNFPERYWHLIPTYSLGEVELNDFVSWALAMARLNESGLLHPSQYAAIWNVLGLPQADMDLFLAEREKEAGLLEEMSKPTINPATGKEEPAQLPTYIKQEVGKTITRKEARGRAARAQSAFSEEL